MSQVVTELIIDADGATRGAGQYSDAMDKVSSAASRGAGAASQAFSRGSGSVQSMGTAAVSAIPLIGGLVNPITVGAAAIIGFTEGIAKFNTGLADMGTASRRAGLDLEKFQQLKFAASIDGVNDKSFAAGAEKMAANLNEAGRGANDLSKLLDANNVKYKTATGALIDQNKLWDISRDLIHRAGDEQSKIKVAEMLGLTKDWVPVLDKSASAFADIQSEASKLGLVINQNVIDRATQFDTEWRKSSTVFSTYMKAQLADLLPIIDDLISRAGGLARTVSDSINKYANSPEGKAAYQNARRATEVLSLADPAGSVEDNAKLLAVAAQTAVGAISDENKALLDQRIAVKDTATMWNTIAIEWENAAAAGHKVAKAAEAAGGPTTTIPGKDTAKNAIDRQIDSINKHIAVMGADAEAVGKTASAHDALRVKAELLEAAARGNIAVNAEWAKTFDNLAAKSGNAADNLARVKLNDQLSFDRDQIGRTDIDATTASRLRSAGLPIDFSSAEAQAIRFNEQLKISKSLSSDFASGFARDMMNGVSASQAMGNALNKLAGTLVDMATRNLVSQAFGGAGGGGIGGLFSSFFGGGGVSPGISPLDGLAAIHHDGGVAGDAGIPTRLVHPSVFAKAPRYHMGVDEVPAILQTGERVLNRQETAAYNKSGKSDSQPLQITYAPSYNVTGTTQDIDQLREQIAKDRQQAPDKILKTIIEAKRIGVIK